MRSAEGRETLDRQGSSRRQPAEHRRLLLGQTEKRRCPHSGCKVSVAGCPHFRMAVLLCNVRSPSAANCKHFCGLMVKYALLLSLRGTPSHVCISRAAGGGGSRWQLCARSLPLTLPLADTHTYCVTEQESVPEQEKYNLTLSAPVDSVCILVTLEIPRRGRK